jgi:hypothetical protein
VKKARQAGALFGGKRQAVERTTPGVPVLPHREVGKNKGREGKIRREKLLTWLNGESNA